MKKRMAEKPGGAKYDLHVRIGAPSHKRRALNRQNCERGNKRLWDAG